MTEATVETGLDHPARFPRGGGRALLGWVRELALLPAIGVLLVVGVVSSPAFFTTSNFSNTAQGSAALGMVVVAETLILLTGSFDLSLQSVYGLAPMVGAWLIVSRDGHGLGTDWSPALGLLVVLGSGAAVGLFNGLMVVKLRFSGLFLRYHRVGRAIYAIGGNLEAARAAGIKVDRIRIGVFCAAGVLAAIGGLMTAGQVLTVTANQGNNLIFTVFAAAVIGGIALEGGRGRILGAFTGVVLLGMVNDVLVLRNTSTFWIDAVNGAIILVALALARAVALVRA
jgi:simple sugar transport system permease protein